MKDRIEAVRGKMSESALRAGRDASKIKLIAVTKTRTVDEMLEAAPFVDGLGENRIQEAASKQKDWPSSVETEWRMIGHLQSNKARKAVALFDYLDSIDSESIARAVDKFAAEENRVIPILVEVNTSGEASKTGVAPEGLPLLLDCVLECRHLRLDGFMTIAPFTDDETQVRKSFAMLRIMAENARFSTGLPLPVLSMGMSGDFELAIAEGSTMVRVGTSLFGLRTR